ncbi:MAG: hypothetical protein P0111_01670 [Nitrospira sp.]|nr:hypothetical protein [Nitrospira sp.]
MRWPIGRTLLACLLLWGGFGCTKPVLKEQVPEPASAPSDSFEDRGVLAGEWEYEEGAVVTLRLDEQGNGTYAWKDGRFTTMALNGRIWEGLWSQRENDREGGFQVEFSSDFSEGEGRWWYTRIGQDHSPSQKGGTFHVTRKNESVPRGDVPR